MLEQMQDRALQKGFPGDSSKLWEGGMGKETPGPESLHIVKKEGRRSRTQPETHPEKLFAPLIGESCVGPSKTPAPRQLPT